MNVMNQKSRLVIEALIRAQVSKSHAKALRMVLPADRNALPSVCCALITRIARDSRSSLRKQRLAITKEARCSTSWHGSC